MTSGGPHASLHKVRPAGRFTKGQSVAPAGGNTEFHGYHYRERTADVAATITDYTRPMVFAPAGDACEYPERAIATVRYRRVLLGSQECEERLADVSVVRVESTEKI